MTGALAGKRILVIEDEYFIASDLRRALAARDVVVVGPAANLEKGLALIEGGRLDGALLDINLMGADSFPIADRLAEDEVPYLFVTGYDGWAIPDAYRHHPRVAKPFAVDAVLGRIEQLIEEKGQ